MPRNDSIQVRRDTAANWTSVNPTLASGEIGFETDTGKFKIGTGSTAWTSLLYATDASDITGATLASNVTGSSLTSVGTLGSLTVTGDVTVDTNTLKVDSTNNRVGIGTASPTQVLDVFGVVRSSGYVEKWLINTIDTSIGSLTLNASTNTSYLYTMPQTSNFTLNVRGNASTTLNNTMATGDQLTITFVYNNNATWYPTSFSIDGVTQYIYWQGGVTPSSGLTNFNVLVYTIIKTGNAGFTIFASQTRFY